MRLTSSQNSLIQHVLDAIDQLLAEVETPTEPASRFDLEEVWYRVRPEQMAALSSLAAAGALMRVTHLLLSRPVSPSPEKRLQEWNDLSELTKEAGRSAYRAALILADPECAVPSGC
ncbi:hypothetical protein [Variovorax fucosicus]|uniref:hypothetical protein n=1 Tax=Variovorax fucosicus TaxID=3053517 RepID=UPI0025764061|nr:hypothetical protein [Variovorax sp. J22G47]MDM0056438.1 hypothetical protein [Variovorax sp. J22G47]